MNAKCKKFLTMLLLVCVSIGAAGCSAYSAYSAESSYSPS